jgi:hypothetical protein
MHSRLIEYSANLYNEQLKRFFSLKSSSPKQTCLFQCSLTRAIFAACKHIELNLPAQDIVSQDFQQFPKYPLLLYAVGGNYPSLSYLASQNPKSTKQNVASRCIFVISPVKSRQMVKSPYPQKQA